MRAPDPADLPVSGTEALEDALRRAVERGQAIADARHLSRLAARLAAVAARPRGSPAPPTVAATRRFRVAEVTIAFEAELRRDPAVAGGFAFVGAVPAGSLRKPRSWPRRFLDALRGRRFAPVTITIRPGAARRDATGTGTGTPP